MIVNEFQRQVEASPGNIAIKMGNQTITYQELDTRSTRLAKAICTKEETGNDQKQRVALLFEHGADMIISVLGALKADKTYVPLDISYPEKRLFYMLENSESYLIITNTANVLLAGQLAEGVGGKIDILNIDSLDIANGDKTSAVYMESKTPGNEDQLAYILYTSGSTGQPKGVMQTHRNVLYYTRNWIQRFSITESDRMTLFSAFSHDGSVQDMFAALLSGATLYPYYIKTTASTYELYTLLMKEKITIWHSVPSLYRFFAGTLTEKDRFYDIRWVLLGGEPLRPHDFKLYSAFFPKATLANVYGQTESSVSTICTIFHGDVFDNVSLGIPLDETKILLVDEDGDIIETMGVGEIVVASDYIAPGYWKDRVNTERVFTRDDELGRLYWTGDLGRITVGGNIKAMGRKDYQIKIRGFRVETGEIESVLLRHPAVKEVVVMAKQDEKGDNYLCTYFKADGIIPAEELRAHLSKEVPDYMIPRFFIPLEKMPLTPNGKIDRQQLPELEEGIASKSVYVAPTNEIEEKLAVIWQEVLAVERVGIHDNFIELGGHSLLLISIISRIHQELNVELQFGDVFENPTIKEVAQLVMTSTPSFYTAIRPVEEKEYYPATSDQKRLFILNQFEGISTTYNLPGVWKMEGDMNPSHFEKMLQILVDRHDAYRTSFKMVDNELVQVIHKKVDFSLQYIDAENQENKSENTIKEISRTFIQPFNLNIPPLLRIAMVKLSANEHVLLFDSHHIITDGVSSNICVQDFYRLYLGVELPRIKLRYRDYAEWQNSLENTGQLKKQEEYWLNMFNGKIPVLDLPGDYPRPAVQSFEGDMVAFRLNNEVSEQLNRLVKETGTTLFMVLLAMFYVLMHKYTGQEDIVIGTILAGRNNTELENIIGLLVKTLALRNCPAPNKSFDLFLQEVKRNTLQTFENQMYPFSRLVEKLKLAKDRSRNPLFDAAFVLQNRDMTLSGKYRGDIDLKLISTVFENNTSLFDLYFQAVESRDEILCCFQYNTMLFKRETIELMKERFLILIKNILTKKSEKIRDIVFSLPMEVEIRKTEEVDFEF